MRPLGIRLTGAWEQPHVRPWSSAISFESDAGRLWFKVNGPGIRFEAALVDLLGKVVPIVPGARRRPRPGLVADPGRRPDAALGGAARGGVVVVVGGHRRPVRRAQARAGRPPRRAAGGRRRRGLPATLPGQARALVAEAADREPDDGGLTREEVAGLEALLPEYDAWCATLAASGVPDSAQHDDLHSSNICWTGSVDTARIIDWGDTSVGHPIATMLCTMNSIAWHARCEVDDPRVLRVRDAPTSSRSRRTPTGRRSSSWSRSPGARER